MENYFYKLSKTQKAVALAMRALQLFGFRALSEFGANGFNAVTVYIKIGFT